MTAETIVAQIHDHKPNLPPAEALLPITFSWNEEGLSCWDGGVDLNEDLRDDVFDLLEPTFETKDEDYLPILRFLLQQEIKNSRYGETCPWNFRSIFEYVAAFRKMEDVVLLLEAIQDTCFDASLALNKDRLFWNGYQEVIEYVRTHYENGEDLVDDLAFFGDYFGFDQPDWKPVFPEDEMEES